ncbi:LysR family transcriptional regulator [Schaalia naturae]|uniref:LysR family transcriptional regulator n=1 Tax=Schaalia naturae TaxID=635203 RepID=A0ABW2SJD9_9ACTO
MDTRLLEYFVSVATEEGVLRAADELSTAQSTVSSGIHRLERELGTALFAKVGRRLQLTEAGEQLLPTARRILDGVSAMGAYGLAEGQGLRGRVRLGIFPGMESDCGLPEALAGFAVDNPGVEVRTYAPMRGSTGAAQDVRRGRLDVAFCALPDDLLHVESIELADFPYRAFLPSGHRLAGVKAVDLRDLSAERWVDVLPGYGNRKQLDAFLQNQGIPRRVTTEVATLPSVASYVAVGLGIAVIPDVVARGGCLVRAVEQDLPPWTVSLVVREGGMEQPQVRSLVERLTSGLWRPRLAGVDSPPPNTPFSSSGLL